MKNFPLAVAWLTFMLVSSAVLAQPVRQIPVQDFFRNPEKSDYQISPDGKWISHTEPYQKRMNIFVQPSAGGAVKRITSVTDRDIDEYLWKGNKRLLYTRDFDGDENYHLFRVNVDGSHVKDLTPFDSVRVEIIDELEDNDTDILIGINKRDREVFDAYRLNTVTGNLTLVAENPGNILGWITDHDEKIRLATTTDGVNTSILYRENEQEPFKIVMTTSFKEKLIPLFFTFDNRHLYAASNIGRDKIALVEVDPRTGKEIKELYAHPEVDIDEADYSRQRKVLTYISYVTWKQERKFVDAATQALFTKLEKKLLGKEVYVNYYNKAEDMFIIRALNDRTSGAYYVYDQKNDRLTKLAERNPWLKESDLCEMKPITYQTRDGQTIHGYLTLPKGKPARQLPVVVNPHGGPWDRDAWGFDREVQFLANRGYAVLQMNFRGSTGYGRQFWEASFKQWGLKMQDDISDGVKYLINEGIADPKRVGIYGGSYGGYATLAGLAFSPELYTCGVDYVGVSNLFTFMETIPPYWKPMLGMLHEMVGDPQQDSLLLVAASPVFHVERIKAPLFVAQGAKDPRVNIEESNQIVAALKKRGVDVQYMVKENEGHGFVNEENRFDFYTAMEKFLAKHLQPTLGAGEKVKKRP